MGDQLSSHFVSPASAHLTKTYVKNGVNPGYLGSRSSATYRKKIIRKFKSDNAVKVSIKGWQQKQTDDNEAKVTYYLYQDGSEVNHVTVLREYN